MIRGVGGRTERQAAGAVQNGHVGHGVIITGRDQKLVDEAWHRFWAKRGVRPPKVSHECLEYTQEKKVVGVDKRSVD